MKLTNVRMKIFSIRMHFLTELQGPTIHPKCTSWRILSCKSKKNTTTTIKFWLHFCPICFKSARYCKKTKKFFFLFFFLKIHLVISLLFIGNTQKSAVWRRGKSTKRFSLTSIQSIKTFTEISPAPSKNLQSWMPWWSSSPETEKAWRWGLN